MTITPTSLFCVESFITLCTSIMFVFFRDEIISDWKAFWVLRWEHQCYSMPSMSGLGAEGMRLMRIALFPFIKSRESREVAWLQHSLSSTPVCLVIACASFFTCFSAVLCHPPRDSNAKGTKTTPCLSHSSAVPLIFRLKAKSKLWPGVSAAWATVACWRGLMTVHV